VKVIYFKYICINAAQYYLGPTLVQLPACCLGCREESEKMVCRYVLGLPGVHIDLTTLVCCRGSSQLNSMYIQTYAQQALITSQLLAIRKPLFTLIGASE
jgi:hypothetical protein